MAKKGRVLIDFDEVVWKKLERAAKVNGVKVNKFVKNMVLEFLMSGDVRTKKVRIVNGILQSKIFKKALWTCVDSAYGEEVAEDVKVEVPVVKEEKHELTEEEDIAECNRLMREWSIEQARKKKAEAETVAVGTKAVANE